MLTVIVYVESYGNKKYVIALFFGGRLNSVTHILITASRDICTFYDELKTEFTHG